LQTRPLVREAARQKQGLKFQPATFRQEVINNNKGLEDEMDGTCSTNGGKRNVYRLLVGKPEGRRPMGRPRRRWVDNVRMELVEVGWGDVDWIGLAQDRDRWRALVNSVLNLRVP
jgi:hypothetical protein